MILAGIILAALVIEAAYEAVHGDNHGLKSNLLLAATMLGVEALGLIVGQKYGFLIYAGVRFCLFDYMFSYFRYGHIWYIGTTSLMDRMISGINKYLLLSMRGLIILYFVL